MVGRVNNYDITGALRQMRELYDCGVICGGELMMLTDYYRREGEVVSLVGSSGVPFPVIHCEKEVGSMISTAGATDDADMLSEALRLFGLNCRFGGNIGASSMVLHLWGGRDSDSHFAYNAGIVPELLDIIRPYGIRLLIENIPCTTSDPLTHWREFEKYDIGYVFDTRFGAFHSQIGKIFAQTDLWTQGRISHMHISDYGGAPKDFTKLHPILHPREGCIDFEMVSRGLNDVKYTGTVTLESPVMVGDGLDIAKLKNTLVFLNEILK